MQEYTTGDIDHRFALLDRYERRCIINFLKESETAHVPISDMVGHLQDQDPTTSDDKQIEIELHHIHLPKLATLDGVEFDFRSGTVQYSGDEFIEALLETALETCASDS